MNKLKNLIAEARQLHDELELKFHLMSMEFKDKWHELSDKLEKAEKAFEQDMLSRAEKIGKAEEFFYAGSEEELEQLVNEFQELNDSYK